jgi:hypothetical protein
LTCNSAGTCTQCVQNAVLKAGACSICPVGCSQCDSQDITKCAGCIRGFVLNNGKCEDSICSKGCIACSSDGKVCTACNNGYTLSKDKCFRCPGRCTGSCNPLNINECTSCMRGFYLENNDCERCGDICLSCTSASVCNACIEGYSLNAATSTCVKNCLFPCQTCSTTSCDTCATGYTKNSVDGNCYVDLTCNPNCENCLPGSYADPSLKCTVCPTERCATCPGGDCEVCFDGYHLSVSGTTKTCVACVNNCLTCFDANTCLLCR